MRRALLSIEKRNEKNPILLDENTYNNMRSVGTFCSTVRGSMVTVMSYMGFYTGANEFIYMGATPVTNDIFGVRYIYIRNGDYFPGTSDLTPVITTEDMVVYENEKAMPIGFAVNTSVQQDWDYARVNAGAVLSQFAQTSTGIEPEIFEAVYPTFGVKGSGCDADYDSGVPTSISYDNASGEDMSVSVNFEVDEDGRYFSNIRANYIDERPYTLNGLKQANDRYQTQMMDLGNLKKGDVVHLKITFSDSYSPSGTITAYISKLNQDALTMFRANLIKRRMNVTEFRDGYLKGEITLEDDQMIFTSIPYDEGWTVYLDGKEIEPCQIAEAFLGIEAGAGKHEIEMKYLPEGFRVGLVISVISWLGFITLSIIISLTRKAKKSIIK